MTATICILPSHSGVGGPASFRARISAGFKELGAEVTFDPAQGHPEAILVIGGTRRLDQLWRAKRRGVRIIQRLNGMNWVHRVTRTGLRHYLRAEINNRILSTIRQDLASAIVYQSAFSGDWWERVHGKVDRPTFLIHNGVDLLTYKPADNPQLPDGRIRILVVEGHFGGGYEIGLQNAVNFCKALQHAAGKPVDLILAGDPGESLPARYAAEKWIEWKGIVPRAALPALYQSAHLFFSADLNASCPNAVIEALACGVPVTGYDTGSLAELLAGQGGTLSPYDADPWQLQPADPLPLARAACGILANRQKFSQQARKRAEEVFDITKIARDYLDVLLGS